MIKSNDNARIHQFIVFIVARDRNELTPHVLTHIRIGLSQDQYVVNSHCCINSLLIHSILLARKVLHGEPWHVSLSPWVIHIPALCKIRNNLLIGMYFFQLICWKKCKDFPPALKFMLLERYSCLERRSPLTTTSQCCRLSHKPTPFVVASGSLVGACSGPHPPIQRMLRTGTLCARPFLRREGGLTRGDVFVLVVRVARNATELGCAFPLLIPFFLFLRPQEGNSLPFLLIPQLLLSNHAPPFHFLKKKGIPSLGIPFCLEVSLAWSLQWFCENEYQPISR